MQTEVGAHLIMDTKVEHVLDSSQAPELTMEGSKPEIPSSKVNVELAQAKTDNDRITEAESNQSGSRGRDAYSHNKDSEETSSQSTTSGSSDGSKSFNIRNEWSSLEVSYSDIKAATNDLSESAEIGKGGYGSVYKGKLNGNMVAIKILNPTSKQGQREFFQELEVLYGMRHSNLVKLVGACFKVRALVYEYLPNGSLEDCLNYNPELLTWQMRTRIIYEICSALIYLHSRSVVHGDLKPANILLDANFKSKLSDFGLCRFLPEDMTTAAYLETVPKGTYGYIDPWFMETCILRPGSDLYSFGITSLKLLTGKSPIGLGFKVRGANENSLREMIDPTAGIWPFELAKEMVYWSLRCCYHNENWKLLVDMSACLEDMLADIEAHEEGRFKCSPQHMNWKSFYVRGLENGIMPSIERAIAPDHVEAVVPAVDIVPFDGELVSLSANNQNEIKADPDMQHGSESHNSSGRAPFTVFLWEITTFLCRCFVDLRK